MVEGECADEKKNENQNPSFQNLVFMFFFSFWEYKDLKDQLDELNDDKKIKDLEKQMKALEDEGKQDSPGNYFPTFEKQN